MGSKLGGLGVAQATPISFEDGKKLRLTWQPKGREKPTTLQVYVLPSGTKTAVHFHQEKFQDGNEREAMRAHWQAVFGKLQKFI